MAPVSPCSSSSRMRARRCSVPTVAMSWPWDKIATRTLARRCSRTQKFAPCSWVAAKYCVRLIAPASLAGGTAEPIVKDTRGPHAPTYRLWPYLRQHFGPWGYWFDLDLRYPQLRQLCPRRSHGPGSLSGAVFQSKPGAPHVAFLSPGHALHGAAGRLPGSCLVSPLAPTSGTRCDTGHFLARPGSHSTKPHPHALGAAGAVLLPDDSLPVHGPDFAGAPQHATGPHLCDRVGARHSGEPVLATHEARQSHACHL